ncbi:hypothetical protein ACE6H2_020952 [Prunus campanulata]
MNSNSLTSRILRAGYFPGGSVLDADVGVYPSFVWKSLLWGRDLLMVGLRWRVVCDLITNSGHWDRDLVNASFWQHEADAALSIPMGYVLRNEDRLVWHYEKTSCYTVRSGYWLACAIRDREDGDVGASRNNFENVWLRLWWMQVATKVKVFLWRCMHEILPC